ncbi:hypothetical protein QBC47DRAFT_402943 [Echria macrotheca]|uniref:Ketoreductase domain-containing protein n=1 Tax=Echria macrotheca TaxID=438768 RepID=A0AAJ0F8M8_9PEZI|nr:hypothetical protein QBC47DRAFT_402943 [Echria macrotheca]
MADALQTPYKTYRTKSYPSIDPTQPSLSTAGKSAVLTGAGSGIGASIALSLARSGISHLALIGRREHALLSTKTSIHTISPSTKVSIYPLSLTSSPSLATALASFASQTPSGKIDILIANAGSLGPLSSLTSASSEEWWETFEVNVLGNFNLIRAFLGHAVADASVVYITSAIVHGPYFPNESAYCASKAGATKMFEYLHYEHPDLTVLAVQPGLIRDTGMLAGFEFVAEGLGMGVDELPWDDAALPGDFVVWAVSPEARFLNGRFVWANWDVDEMKGDKEGILANPRKFTLGLV